MDFRSSPALGARVGRSSDSPLYFYEERRRSDGPQNLPDVHNIGFESCATSRSVLREPPGPKKLHPTAGATVITARVLIAFNVSLRPRTSPSPRRSRRDPREGRRAQGHQRRSASSSTTKETQPGQLKASSRRASRAVRRSRKGARGFLDPRGELVGPRLAALERDARRIRAGSIRETIIQGSLDARSFPPGRANRRPTCRRDDRPHPSRFTRLSPRGPFRGGMRPCFRCGADAAISRAAEQRSRSFEGISLRRRRAHALPRCVRRRHGRRARSRAPRPRAPSDSGIRRERAAVARALDAGLAHAAGRARARVRRARRRTRERRAAPARRFARPQGRAGLSPRERIGPSGRRQERPTRAVPRSRAWIRRAGGSRAQGRDPARWRASRSSCACPRRARDVASSRISRDGAPRCAAFR